MNQINLITVVFFSTMAMISIGLIVKKKYNFLIGTIIFLILFSAFLYIEYKFGFHVENLLLIFVCLTVTGHVLIGQFFNQYQNPYFDKLLHVFGSFAFSLFTYSSIEKIIRPGHNPTIYRSIMIVSLGIALGVLFEIVEFTLDKISGSNHQKGLKDTNLDLIANVLGSLIAGIISFYNS